MNGAERLVDPISYPVGVWQFFAPVGGFDSQIRNIWNQMHYLDVYFTKIGNAWNAGQAW